MGYYTRYNLKIWQYNDVQPDLFDKDKIEWSPEIKEAYTTHPGYDYAVDEDGDSYDEVKWYDHDDDMLEHSRKYPNLVFRLTGEGEESGDQWCTYYQNGKSKTHKAEEWVPPEFDPKELS